MNKFLVEAVLDIEFILFVNHTAFYAWDIAASAGKVDKALIARYKLAFKSFDFAVVVRN